MVTATSAEMRYNPNTDSLSVYLTDADVTGDLGEQFHGRFPTLHREIPLRLAAKDETGDVRPSDCPSRNISREMEHQRMTIERLKKELAAQAAFEMFSGDLGAFQTDVWAKKRRELGYAKSRWHRLHTEPWRRWANGFSCFFFVMVGAPLAMRLRYSDLFATFGACFLPILIVYYPLLMVGVGQAKSGSLPPYCVWLGNLILMVVGIVLVRRECRY